VAFGPPRRSIMNAQQHLNDKQAVLDEVIEERDALWEAKKKAKEAYFAATKDSPEEKELLHQYSVLERAYNRFDLIVVEGAKRDVKEAENVLRNTY
jgi:hypothetical protein